MSNWIAWLCDEREQGKRRAREKDEGTAKPVRLQDATVRRILSPLRACLSTARHEGLIRSNPCDGVPLPHRPQVEVTGDGEPVRKALTREQLAMFLRVVPAKWRVLFRTLASTGLRWSELAALRWGDLRLEGSEPCLRVRRAYVRGAFKPPKSKYGKRTIPLDASLCQELREHRRGSESSGEEDLVFSARNGSTAAPGERAAARNGDRGR